MFLIAYFQDNVFESFSDVERSLANVSVFLSNNFERIARCLIETGSFSKVPVGLSIVFIPSLFKFFRCFKLWKVPDEVKLTKRIIRALIALEDAVVVQRRDDPDNIEGIKEATDQIDRLRGKMVQINGQKALDDYDEERRSDRALTSSQQSFTVCTGSSRMTSEEIAHEVLLNPNTRLNDFAGLSTEQDSVGEIVFKRTRQYHWDLLHEDLLILPVPRYTRVVRALDAIREGLVESVKFNAEMRQTQQSRIQVLVVTEEEVNSTLNIPVIKELLELSAATFEWESMMSLVASTVSLIRRLQFATRVAETDRLYAELNLEEGSDSVELRPKLLVNAIEFLHGRIDTLRIDASNKRCVCFSFFFSSSLSSNSLIFPSISNVLTAIRVHGVGFEQEKFEKKLTDGSISLQNTEVC